MSDIKSFGEPCFAPTCVEGPSGLIEFVRAGAGEPAIVLETGMSHDLTTWNPIIASLAKLSTVFGYNRPGYGRSSDRRNALCVETAVLELRSALSTCEIEGPYVLVGHSYGACIVQAFAERFPSDTVGLVSIDAATPEIRELVMTSPDGHDYRENLNRMSGVVRAEWEATIRPDRAAPHKGQDFVGPMIILTATANRIGWPEFEEARITLADKNAARFPQAEHRRVTCGHNIHHERPLSVLDAVEEVMARANPLSSPEQ